MVWLSFAHVMFMFCPLKCSLFIVRIIFKLCALEQDTPALEAVLPSDHPEKVQIQKAHDENYERNNLTPSDTEHEWEKEIYQFLSLFSSSRDTYPFRFNISMA